MTESHGAVVTEIRGEVTDADGKPVITSIVTVLGEAASDSEADEVSAQIAAAARCRDRENDCWAKLFDDLEIRPASRREGPRFSASGDFSVPLLARGPSSRRRTQPKKVLRRFANNWYSVCWMVSRTWSVSSNVIIGSSAADSS